MKTIDEMLDERSLVFYMGSGKEEVDCSKSQIVEVVQEYSKSEVREFYKFVKKYEMENMPKNVAFFIAPFDHVWQLYLKSKTT